MAIPWIAALKIIPWKDVIAATPQIAKGAQKLYESVRNRPKAVETPISRAEIEQLQNDPQEMAQHVSALRKRLGQLEREQNDAAALLRSLAEHNEKLVSAVETLRVRTRFLLRLSYALIAAVIVLAIVVARMN